MTASQAQTVKPGFPFTPSRFKGLPQLGPTTPVFPGEPWQHHGNAVTASQIDENTTQRHGENSPRNATTMNADGRGFDRRLDRRSSGLRQLPLQGFIWGNRGARPQPRTRGEDTLIWVIRGRLSLSFPRHRQILQPGTLHFIPSGTAFAAMPLGEMSGQVLLIAPSLTGGLSHALPRRSMGGAVDHDDPILRQVLLGLADETGRDTANARAAIACQLNLLALRLSRLEHEGHPETRGARHVHPPDLPLVDRFIAVASGRLADGSTIGDLADELDVSTAKLDIACQHKFGKRAIEMVHQIRYRRAVRLLRDTDEPPARIAQLLGYTSLTHFTRSFVAATGRLPENFRELG